MGEPLAGWASNTCVRLFYGVKNVAHRDAWINRQCAEVAETNHQNCCTPNWCTSDGDSRSKVGSLKFMYFGEQLKIRIYLPRKEEPFLLQIIIEALSCIGNLAFEETFGQIWHICYLSKEIYMTIDIFLVMVIGGSWWWWLVAVVCGEMVVMMRPVHLHDLIQQLVCFLQVHLGKNSMAPPPTLLITRSLIQYFLNTANTSNTSTTQTTTIEHK